MQNIKHGQTVISRIIKDDLIRMTVSESKYNKLGMLNVNTAIKDSLTSGKRVRSIITGCINNWENTNYILFIEYIHTASLIINDLPCMENIAERRKTETIHVKYNEYTAQLVSSLLLTNAMYHITKGHLIIKHAFIVDKLSELINTANGNTGMCGGYYLDKNIEKLKYLSTREQRDLILEIMKMKTGTIFGLAFVLGWVANGANISIENMEEINSAGCDLGICYQIIEDVRNLKKSNDTINSKDTICSYFSHNDIIDIFTEKISVAVKTCKKYDIFNATIKEIINYMTKKFSDCLPCDSRN